MKSGMGFDFYFKYYGESISKKFLMSFYYFLEIFFTSTFIIKLMSNVRKFFVFFNIKSFYLFYIFLINFIIIVIVYIYILYF